MFPRERQLARLLRALIACCALLFAFAPPSFAAEAARDTSGWVAERMAVAAVTRAAPRAPASRAAARRRQPLRASTLLQPALPARTARTAPPGRRTTVDARHLYLDLRTLLC